MEMRYEVTNLRDVAGLARKLRRRRAAAYERGRDAKHDFISVRGDTLIVDGEKPWAELAGHMTISTEIIPRRDNR